MTALALLPSVKTPSLIVREISLGDALPFARFMTTSAYQQHLAVRYPNEHAVRAFVSRAIQRQDRQGRSSFHVAGQCRQTDHVSGDGFIQFHEQASAEIGWGIDPECWGRGLGTEIAQVLIATAIERLGSTTVWCKVMAGNQASMRVAEKAGLAPDRVVSGYRAGFGRDRDVHIYSLSADAYFDAPY